SWPRDWSSDVCSSDLPFERTLCAVVFDAIDSVAYRGFHRSEEDRILSLLAIRPLSGTTGGTIDLGFSGAATIRLCAAAISCRAQIGRASCRERGSRAV